MKFDISDLTSSMNLEWIRYYAPKENMDVTEEDKISSTDLSGLETESGRDSVESNGKFLTSENIDETEDEAAVEENNETADQTTMWNLYLEGNSVLDTIDVTDELIRSSMESSQMTGEILKHGTETGDFDFDLGMEIPIEEKVVDEIEQEEEIPVTLNFSYSKTLTRDIIISKLLYKDLVEDSFLRAALDDVEVVGVSNTVNYISKTVKKLLTKVNNE